MVTTIQKDIFFKSGFKIEAKREDGPEKSIPGRLRCWIRIGGIKLDISEESYELLTMQMK